ncbi:hypothetical protein FHS81_003052 [Pseudochelatococcus contaminans]|uniref:Uncharacterized protein n=1 Tax=Pseudochelatococcus contaminans TaxID=1538103 RepID=A0A7W5Z6D2_9HYPH|nr:hypothetical protein [Pseudochelatococcus contaminans]
MHLPRSAAPTTAPRRVGEFPDTSLNAGASSLSGGATCIAGSLGLSGVSYAG